MQELLIYTPQITQRVNYTFQLFFDALVPTPYSITTDEAVFKGYDGPRLNYSATAFPNDKIQIIPYGLLTEIDVKKQSISVSEWRNLKIFFEVSSGSVPFDVFSASFYLISRYEEYLSHETDMHKRFRHVNSLAFKSHFLDEPLVNLWAEELKKIILVEYPAIVFDVNKYSFTPTMDIDVAYAYLGRSLGLTLGSYLKTLSKFDVKTAIEKKLVLLHLKKDPFDTFEYQENIFKKYKLRPIYFFLAGKRGQYDRNISPKNRKFKRLVKRTSTFAGIGIHPSYQSNSSPDSIAAEIKNIEQNIPEKISCSRQHFLKLNLPQTYRSLAKLGITDDYTMAYAGVGGFRASICTPFFFYDLPAESILPVKVHSSVIMDGTLDEYLKLSPDDATLLVRDLVNKVKKVNGEFISIWHNHSINDIGRRKGWRVVFENMIEAAV